jgi:hypothetical protein
MIDMTAAKTGVTKTGRAMPTPFTGLASREVTRVILGFVIGKRESTVTIITNEPRIAREIEIGDGHGPLYLPPDPLPWPR